MSEKEIFNINGQEDLILLNEEDERLSSEQIYDLEGPIDNEEPLEIPDFLEIIKELRNNDLEVIGEREPWSGGVFGPIFRIKTRSISTGKEQYVIERTFTEVKDIERRFSLVNSKENIYLNDSEPRYKIVNHLDQGKDKLVIDYLYNEERALLDLQKIEGVPKFYGAVYDDLLGSTLEEFIDGYDLSEVLLQETIGDVNNIISILEKVKIIYIKAAELGYIHGDPVGSTIMVDRKNNPYLTDWYLYAHGSFTSNNDLNKKYIKGLEQINELQKRVMAD